MFLYEKILIAQKKTDYNEESDLSKYTNIAIDVT